MTITLSIEEVRAFESAYRTWAEKCETGMFLDTYNRLSQTEKDDIRPFLKKIMEDFTARQAAWLAKNPEPKLVPPV